MNIHRRFCRWAIWRVRWALWQRLQYVWLALVFTLFVVDLDHTNRSHTDSMALLALWLVARVIRKVRP